MTRVLVDTNAFLWAIADDPRLGAQSRMLLNAPDTDPVLSVVSALEIAIKWSIGKLALPDPPDVVINAALRTGGYSRMLVDYPHAALVAKLMPIHTDPFDRLLVAQASLEGLPILTSDTTMSDYGIATIDARR